MATMVGVVLGNSQLHRTLHPRGPVVVGGNRDSVGMVTMAIFYPVRTTGVYPIWLLALADVRPNTSLATSLVPLLVPM
jgi:hypothetical protein